MEFSGVALVTGAASGIGRQTAILYAKEGCQRISIADLNAGGLKETEEIIHSISKNVTVRYQVCDVTDETSVQSMINGTVEQFGRLDYCCNVAGMVLLGVNTADMTTDFFEKHYQVNLKGLFFCQRAELQVMLKQEPLKSKDSKYAFRGSIANVSSMAGLNAEPSLPAYSASKHGVIGLSKSCMFSSAPGDPLDLTISFKDGMFYGQHGIRVNALCPGAVATPILANSGNDVSQAPLKEADSMDNALRRFGDPEEIAECLIWLTSSRASYVTATTLAANGGQIGV